MTFSDLQFKEKTLKNKGFRENIERDSSEKYYADMKLRNNREFKEIKEKYKELEMNGNQSINS